MDDQDIFEDLTIEETILFGDNIKSPFSDFEHVFRSVISSMSLQLAQRTPADWYRDMLNGMPEGWEPPEAKVPKVPVKFGVDDAQKWRERQEKAMELAARMDKTQLWLCWMSDRAGTGLEAGNLVEWTMEVIQEIGKDVSSLELRRKVANEFQAEAKSAGDWDLWLCDLAWVSDRRDALAAGVAAPLWKNYITHKNIGEKKKLGLETFMAWLNGQQEDADPEKETDSPLESAEEQQSEGAVVSGV